MVLELLNEGRAMDVTRSGAKFTVDETLGIPKPDNLGGIGTGKNTFIDVF